MVLNQADRRLMPTVTRITQTLVNLLTSARFVVDGNSMSPALDNGQWVLAVRPIRSWNRLRRGDIVVLRHPVWTKRTFIKRIVGLPDEEVCLEGGIVYLNGVLLEEEYIAASDSGGLESGSLESGSLESKEVGVNRERHHGEWWNGPEEYFVLGDNRQDSQDSRVFGPVDRRLILGRVWFRCWPLRSWGAVPGRRSGSG